MDGTNTIESLMRFGDWVQEQLEIERKKIDKNVHGQTDSNAL